MKIENYIQPKSSFLSVEKDLSIIIDRIIKNKRLQRLLYYTTSDALDKPNLTQEQTMELLDNNIRIIPKDMVYEDLKTVIYINMDNFFTNQSNPEFRNNLIKIHIVCPIEIWKLKDFQLRPYRIAAEIDTMLNKQRLTGIGKIEFYDGQMIPINDDLYTFCLLYSVIHGEEDKKRMPNPADEEQFLKDFEEYIEAK